MRTCTALGNRKLPLMSAVARTRFSHITDQQLRELYAFLSARAATTPVLAP
jgi:cytochrome c553